MRFVNTRQAAIGHLILEGGDSIAVESGEVHVIVYRDADAQFTLTEGSKSHEGDS